MCRLYSEGKLYIQDISIVVTLDRPVVAYLVETELVLL